MTEGGRVLDAPVTYSAMYERLKFYLKILGIDEGETPHSLHAGCAITLAIGGGKVQADGIMSHIGWSGTGNKNGRLLLESNTTKGCLFYGGTIIFTSFKQ